MKGLGFEPRDREREKARGELIFQFDLIKQKGSSRASIQSQFESYGPSPDLAVGAAQSPKT
jgi:hypothetical protein